MATMRAAVYARVSTADQTCENQLIELRRYCAARGWDATEYVDTGVSGAKDRRPALDRLVVDARRRKVDTVVVWRLDRLGRNLRHLILLIDELPRPECDRRAGAERAAATARQSHSCPRSRAELDAGRCR